MTWACCARTRVEMATIPTVQPPIGIEQLNSAIPTQPGTSAGCADDRAESATIRTARTPGCGARQNLVTQTQWSISALRTGLMVRSTQALRVPRAGFAARPSWEAPKQCSGWEVSALNREESTMIQTAQWLG